MATTPNEYTLKGKLQIVLDGSSEPMELGEIEIPVRVDFHKPTKPGAVYRGNPGITPVSKTIGDHGSQRDG